MDLEEKVEKEVMEEALTIEKNRKLMENFGTLADSGKKKAVKELLFYFVINIK